MTLPAVTVRQVMNPDPARVSPDTPVQEALRLMNARRIGTVLVVEGGDLLLGIFTERDLIRRVLTADEGWRGTPVGDWMTRDPHTVGPDVGWEEAAGLLERLKVRHLPVVEAGRVVGLISSRLLIAHREEFFGRAIEERTAELRRANEQLLARDAEMLYNLRAAGRLQNRVLLPQTPPDWPDLRWSIHFAPLDHLGGDYYDFAAPSPDHLGFLIADASGHSIPAALVAILARFGFAQAAGATPHPGDVLSAMNRRLQDLTEERFVTAFYGVLDRRTGVFRYSSAGHPPPLHFEAKTGRVRELLSQGFMLGIMPEEVYAEREVALESGDKLIFYTDGLVEARNEIGELFGTQRLTECLTEHGREASAELLAHVLECQKGFCGQAPLTDDVTAAVVEVVPAP
jgi:serine phosphatase RsbU (regulator of sigma subunit)/CBS domain-containing protein